MVLLGMVCELRFLNYINLSEKINFKFGRYFTKFSQSNEIEG